LSNVLLRFILFVEWRVLGAIGRSPPPKNFIPAAPHPPIIASLRSLKGAIARRSWIGPSPAEAWDRSSASVGFGPRRRDGARRPRVWSRGSGTRAAPGLRPGPLRVPARSWLTTVRSIAKRFRSPFPDSARRGEKEPQRDERIEKRDTRGESAARRGAKKTPHAARREAPAAVRKDRGRHRLALFGAPLPFGEDKNLRYRPSACLSACNLRYRPSACLSA
jgi:hypothetical protein